MVIVSHSIEQIQRLCDRVIWLDGGRVIGDGAANAILPQYKEAMVSMEVQKRRKVGVC
jgi:ABC-type polysaccharide/polyol phosphate transport system ATPase subunit